MRKAFWLAMLMLIPAIARAQLAGDSAGTPVPVTPGESTGVPTETVPSTPSSAENPPAPAPTSSAPAPSPSPSRPVPSLDLTEDLFAKITAQGVPEHGLRKIFDALRKDDGREFMQETYTCKERGADDVRPCDDNKRIPSSKKLILHAHPYAAVVDFSRLSTEKRFFLIRWADGKVESFYSSHGKGSGDGSEAWKFSNTKDSQQTSLGLYMTGEIYKGGYGNTLRMYGLEKSNDQAYNRDIVLHGAYYADEDFFNVKNDSTGLPYDRLGLSWGCPAVALSIAKRIIPLLANGALMYHDHDTLAEEALSGREVRGPMPIPLPPRRPKDLVKEPPKKVDAGKGATKMTLKTSTPASAPGPTTPSKANQPVRTTPANPLLPPVTPVMKADATKTP